MFKSQHHLFQIFVQGHCFEYIADWYCRCKKPKSIQSLIFSAVWL